MLWSYLSRPTKVGPPEKKQYWTVPFTFAIVRKNEFYRDWYTMWKINSYLLDIIWLKKAFKIKWTSQSTSLLSVKVSSWWPVCIDNLLPLLEQSKSPKLTTWKCYKVVVRMSAECCLPLGYNCRPCHSLPSNMRLYKIRKTKQMWYRQKPQAFISTEGLWGQIWR